MTVLSIHRSPIFQGGLQEWGKAEADSATDGEGAKCKKTMSLDHVSQMNVYNGMHRTRGHWENGKDWDGKQANKASGRLRLLGMMEVRGHDTGFRQHAEGPIEIAGLPRTKEGSFVSKLTFLMLCLFCCFLMLRRRLSSNFVAERRATTPFLI